MLQSNMCCLGLDFFMGRSSAIATAYFVWAACLSDFFDGFAARMLKVSSPIGKELDSMADMVSFGALPSLFMYKMLQSASPSEYLPYLALLIAVCSALRLAIFNIDETQSDSFKRSTHAGERIIHDRYPIPRPSVPLTFVHDPIVLSHNNRNFFRLLVSDLSCSPWNSKISPGRITRWGLLSCSFRYYCWRLYAVCRHPSYHTFVRRRLVRVFGVFEIKELILPLISTEFCHHFPPYDVLGGLRSLWSRCVRAQSSVLQTGPWYKVAVEKERL